MDLKKVLASYGVETDRWVRLIPNISEILLDSNATNYVDDDELYYFDTTNELLYISKAYGYSKIPKDKISTDFGTYKKANIIDTSRIIGFMSTTVMGPSGLFLERTF